MSIYLCQSSVSICQSVSIRVNLCQSVSICVNVVCTSLILFLVNLNAFTSAVAEKAPINITTNLLDGQKIAPSETRNQITRIDLREAPVCFTLKASFKNTLSVSNLCQYMSICVKSVSIIYVPICINLCVNSASSFLEHTYTI